MEGCVGGVKWSIVKTPWVAAHGTLGAWYGVTLTLNPKP